MPTLKREVCRPDIPTTASPRARLRRGHGGYPIAPTEFPKSLSTAQDISAEAPLPDPNEARWPEPTGRRTTFRPLVRDHRLSGGCTPALTAKSSRSSTDKHSQLQRSERSPRKSPQTIAAKRGTQPLQTPKPVALNPTSLSIGAKYSTTS
ncbi:hypothetical protein B0O99DRAFT_696466 [Bisporella sp. PMI_857]|nr:hypothetical protein B0O99DRAFT_696466 [Bisporella sp. PMI_857]